MNKPHPEKYLYRDSQSVGHAAEGNRNASYTKVLFEKLIDQQVIVS